MHIMFIYIKIKIYTLNLVAPAPVAHAYPLLPYLEIIFAGLTGMVVLVQVAVVFFYSTIIFMNKKV